MHCIKPCLIHVTNLLTKGLTLELPMCVFALFCRHTMLIYAGLQSPYIRLASSAVMEINTPVVLLNMPEGQCSAQLSSCWSVLACAERASICGLVCQLHWIVCVVCWFVPEIGHECEPALPGNSKNETINDRKRRRKTTMHIQSLPWERVAIRDKKRIIKKNVREKLGVVMWCT